VLRGNPEEEAMLREEASTREQWEPIAWAGGPGFGARSQSHELGGGRVWSQRVANWKSSESPALGSR